MKKFTDSQIKSMIPTVTLRGEKPVTMVWLPQADAIRAMKVVEESKDALWQAEVDRLNATIDELRERLRLTKVMQNVGYNPL